ncbi:MAG: ice-binding family protein [Aeromicrobium sp.]
MVANHRVDRGKAAAALTLTSVLLLLAGMLGTGGISPAAAVATQVDLGTASSFSVLGGSTVTNTGSSVISGDLGVSPGTAVTGFPPGIVLGTIHENDAVAAQAQADLTTAYNNAAGQASDVTLASAELGGLTLVPGVYTASSSAQLTGTLTLDAQGDPNAVFIFQIGSTLTTASNSSVLLINGADPCNVFWQVGSSAILGTNTTFVGTIMALTSVTVNTGASIDGRALARNGAVTLDTNRITTPDCADGGGGGVDTDGTETDGTDTAGTETDGADTAGTATTGTETDGADTAADGTETDGADTAGTATTGTETDGADTAGTATTGTETDGTDTATDGTETDGVDTGATDGTDTDGAETDGVDAGATDGTDTDGAETDGNDDNGNDDNGNDDDDEGSSDRDNVIPKGHPRTGLGGTASNVNPYSTLLLMLGGVAGMGSMIVSAQSFRRATRKIL